MNNSEFLDEDEIDEFNNLEYDVTVYGLNWLEKNDDLPEDYSYAILHEDLVLQYGDFEEDQLEDLISSYMEELISSDYPNYEFDGWKDLDYTPMELETIFDVLDRS